MVSQNSSFKQNTVRRFLFAIIIRYLLLIFSDGASRDVSESEMD